MLSSYSLYPSSKGIILFPLLVLDVIVLLVPGGIFFLPSGVLGWYNLIPLVSPRMYFTLLCQFLKISFHYILEVIMFVPLFVPINIIMLPLLVIVFLLLVPAGIFFLPLVVLGWYYLIPLGSPLWILC